MIHSHEKSMCCTGKHFEEHMLNDRVGNCQKIELRKQIGLFCKILHCLQYHIISLYIIVFLGNAKFCIIPSLAVLVITYSDLMFVCVCFFIPERLRVISQDSTSSS